MYKSIPICRLIFKVLFLFLLTGCYKNHLYVQQEWIDENYLASTRIHGAPDPRKENPPKGQKLLIAWDFPKSLFEQELALHITVRFWDNTEQTFIQPIERKRFYTDLFFPVQNKECRILTYRIEVFTKWGELIETWNHHFWTELIEVGPKA